jgi:uncharacterized membrane protein
MHNDTVIKSTLVSLIASGALLATTSAQAVPDQPAFWEKCAGITKKGKNDCGSLNGKHSCSGQAAWIRFTRRLILKRSMVKSLI